MERTVASVVFVLFFNSLLYLRAYSHPYNSWNFSPYIVGGDFTLAYEYPFMAALGWNKQAPDRVEYLCGGVLIASSIVLTAAHCVFLNGKLPDVINIGGNDLYGSYSNDLHKIKNYFLHPQYDEHQAYNDIALLELDKMSANYPVCLWTSPTLSIKNVTAIGYGATQFAGKKSSGLQKVELVTFSEMVCKPYFKRQRKFRFGIQHSHLCAGDSERKKDTCQGDSGGPLLVDHNFQKYVVGITSTGQACSGFPPAVYTRISFFIDWIEKIVKERGYTLAENCDLE